MGEENINLRNLIESSDSDKEIENEVYNELKNAQSILEYAKDSPLYEKFQKEYQELRDKIISSVENDKIITRQELKEIKWEAENISALEDQQSSKKEKTRDFSKIEGLEKIITRDIIDAIDMSYEIDNLEQVINLYNISPEKAREFLENTEDFPNELIDKTLNALEKRNKFISEEHKKERERIEKELKEVVKVLKEYGIGDEASMSEEIDIKDLEVDSNLRLQVINDLRYQKVSTLEIIRNHEEILKSGSDPKREEKRKQTILNLKRNIQEIDHAISILKQFENIKDIEKSRKRIKAENIEKLELEEKTKEKDDDNHQEKGTESYTSKENTYETDYELNTSWSVPVVETSNWSKIEISVDEAKVIQNNPEAIKNLVNFYNFFKELNLSSVWEYRNELMVAIWDINIDPNDNSVDKEELRKFWNKLLTFVTNIWKEEKEKTKVNLTTISEVNMALRDFSWEDWEFSDNATFNIEWEDAFAAKLRQHWIIWWAYFHIHKFRENLK